MNFENKVWIHSLQVSADSVASFAGCLLPPSSIWLVVQRPPSCPPFSVWLVVQRSPCPPSSVWLVVQRPPSCPPSSVWLVIQRPPSCPPSSVWLVIQRPPPFPPSSVWLVVQRPSPFPISFLLPVFDLLQQTGDQKEYTAHTVPERSLPSPVVGDDALFLWGIRGLPHAGSRPECPTHLQRRVQDFCHCSSQLRTTTSKTCLMKLYNSSNNLSWLNSWHG